VSATEHSRVLVSRLHALRSPAGSELTRSCLGTEGEGIEGSHAEREQSRPGRAYLAAAAAATGDGGGGDAVAMATLQRRHTDTT